MQAAEVWPTPEPIESLDEAPLREFPREVILPRELEQYAVALADRLRIPLGLIAMAQMAAASAVMGGKAFVAPDRDNASWVEPSNLWVVGVAEVSSKKTPVLNAVLRPLYELDKELRDEHQRELEEYEQELEEWKAAKRGERGPKPQRPAQTRLLAADTTKEALAELLAASPAILSYQDELSALFRTWKREDRAAERSFYLSAYSGTPLVVDRITRQATHLERPVLALLGFAQPGVFAEIITEAVQDGGGADGLLQRFIPVVGELLPWVDERPRIPANLAERYAVAVKALYDTTRAWSEEYRVLGFDDEAQPLWYMWEAETEKALRDPNHPTAWRGYLGKRMGLTARLALVLGLLHGEYGRLSATSLRRAIAVVLWAEPHAKRVWARALHGDTTPMAKLAQKLRAGEFEGFTLRDLYRKGVAGIATAQEARRVVEALAEAGWVARDPHTPHRWVVNPRCKGVSGD